MVSTARFAATSKRLATALLRNTWILDRRLLRLEFRTTAVRFRATRGKNPCAQEDCSPPYTPGYSRRLQFKDLVTTMNSQEYVISGVSGRFPESDNLEEFWENLVIQKDLVTDDNRRWNVDLYDLPRRMGKVSDLEKFDARFFRISGKHAQALDPRIRKLLEVTYEAIVDAGISPETISGSRTGVYVSGSGAEAAEIWTQCQNSSYMSAAICAVSYMLANRISYAFNFHGPSVVLDSACSGSLVAVDCALLALKTGTCEYVVAGGASINLSPGFASSLATLGTLSPDGKCRSFDERSNGYVRAEAVAALVLCPTNVAKRLYATILGIKCNNDGYKEEGIGFPSTQLQKRLLSEIYAEIGVDPLSIGFLETHGTGTVVGDPEEVNAISGAFCKTRKCPLLIGSVKTNMGHSETVSDLEDIHFNPFYITSNGEILTARQDGRLSCQLEGAIWKFCVSLWLGLAVRLDISWRSTLSSRRKLNELVHFYLNLRIPYGIFSLQNTNASSTG